VPAFVHHICTFCDSFTRTFTVAPLLCVPALRLRVTRYAPSRTTRCCSLLMRLCRLVLLLILLLLLVFILLLHCVWWWRRLLLLVFCYIVVIVDTLLLHYTVLLPLLMMLLYIFHLCVLLFYCCSFSHILRFARCRAHARSWFAHCVIWFYFLTRTLVVVTLWITWSCVLRFVQRILCTPYAALPRCFHTVCVRVYAFDCVTSLICAAVFPATCTF